MTRLLRPYLYVLPCLIVLALFTYWPILYSVWLSLHKFNILSGASTFVGTHNFSALLTSPDFQNSVRVTFLFTLLTVPLRLVLALGLAQVLRDESRLTRIMRGAYFLPYVTSSVAIGVVWSWIFNTDMGMVNLVIGFLGMPHLPWFQDSNLALVALSVVANWQQLGYDALLYVAALNAIPEEYYEAARLDGAAAWQRFTNLTLPLVAPTTLFLLVVSVVNTFQIFSLVNVMTEGGPANGTNVLMNHLYYLSFILFDVSRGSALAVILFIGLLAITLIQFLLARGRVNYDLG